MRPRGWGRPPRQTTKAMPPQTQDQPAPNSAEGNVDKLECNSGFFLIRRPRAYSFDIGAARPDYLSVSAYFRTLGWRVIGIEPNPKFYEQHKSRGYEVYQFACGDRDEDNVNFNVVDSHGAQCETARFPTNRFSSLGLKESYAKLSGKLDTQTIKVSLRRLSTLLQRTSRTCRAWTSFPWTSKAGNSEGAQQLDLTKHRPTIIIGESVQEKKYEDHPKTDGLHLVAAHPTNDVYVDDTFIKTTGSPCASPSNAFGYKLGLLGKITPSPSHIAEAVSFVQTGGVLTRKFQPQEEGLRLACRRPSGL